MHMYVLVRKIWWCYHWILQKKYKSYQKSSCNFYFWWKLDECSDLKCVIEDYIKKTLAREDSCFLRQGYIKSVVKSS